MKNNGMQKNKIIANCARYAAIAIDFLQFIIENVCKNSDDISEIVLDSVEVDIKLELFKSIYKI